jgi:hypothetical protein
MDADEIKKKIIEDFIRDASPEEIKELNRLLRSREGNKASNPGRMGLNMDVKGLAKEMSSQISRQMGMANLNIKQMSRDLVVQMARQYQPGISEKELSALVEQMVPDKRKTAVPEKIPFDLLKTMIVQFVSYSTGTMQEKDMASLPEGWVKKYWNSFSPELRILINNYLKDGIDNRSFWISVEKLYKK